jgi:hypothetical protein
MRRMDDARTGSAREGRAPTHRECASLKAARRHPGNPGKVPAAWRFTKRSPPDEMEQAPNNAQVVEAMRPGAAAVRRKRDGSAIPFFNSYFVGSLHYDRAARRNIRKQISHRRNDSS